MHWNFRKIVGKSENLGRKSRNSSKKGGETLEIQKKKVKMNWNSREKKEFGIGAGEAGI